MVCADWLNWNTGWWRGKHPEGDKKKWRYILWDEDATFGNYIARLHKECFVLRKPTCWLTPAVRQAANGLKKSLKKRKTGKGRIIVEGDVPSLSTSFKGCPFQARCLFSQERCSEDMEFFDRWIEKGVLEQVRSTLEKPFVRMTYSEAVEVLR